MKRLDRNNVRKGGESHPSPAHSNGDNYERQAERSINVRGEIEARIPGDLIRKYEIERREDSTREKKKFLLDKITVGLTIFVLLLNALLVYYTRQAIIDNGKQFQSDQRPHVWTLEDQ